MIIIRFEGGLGNQMFQYAAGRRLAHVLGVGLKLDLTWFGLQSSRCYDLGNFNIQEDFATPADVEALVVRKRSFVDRVLFRPPGSAPAHIREKHFHFDPDILALQDGVYLVGHWQSVKYFVDIEDFIREEFTVKSPQMGRDKKLAEQVGSCDSVSLHVRRTDYVSNPVANKILAPCTLDYYADCVERLTETVKEPHFFIFSDDPEWAFENLKLPYPTTLVDHNGLDKGYEDLRLMSQCRHHIIANSSFSWWGAWLNPNPAKVVIAPRKWFRQSTNDTKDLCPDGWVLL